MFDVQIVWGPVIEYVYSQDWEFSSHVVCFASRHCATFLNEAQLPVPQYRLKSSCGVEVQVNAVHLSPNAAEEDQ